MSHLLVQQTLKTLIEHGLLAQPIPSNEETCEILEVTLIELTQEQKLTMRVLFVEQPLTLQELAKPLEYWASEEAEASLNTTGYQSMNAAQAMNSNPHASHQENATLLYEVQIETPILQQLHETTAIDIMRLAHFLNRGMMGGYFCIDEMAHTVILKMNGLFSPQQSAHLMAQLGQYLFFLAAHYDTFQEIHQKKHTFESWLEKTCKLMEEAKQTSP